METSDIIKHMKSPMPIAIVVIILSLWLGGALIRGAMMVSLAMFIGIWFLMSYFMSERVQKFMVTKARWALDILISVAAMTFGGTGVTALIAGVYAGVISSVFFGVLAKQYEKQDKLSTT